MNSRLLHLATKLAPPEPPPAQVMRNAIREIISSTPLARLILLRAPAGFGKTTTMGQLQNRVKELRIATSWLTLDDADNDPARLLAGLSAAAAQIALDSSTRSTPNPLRSFKPLSELSVDKLTYLTSPFVLFLDNFHCVNKPDVQQLIGTIIEKLPSSGRIVIGTRVQPKLNLGQLRRSGQILELDAHLLRFSLEETDEFYRNCCSRSLTEEEISRLHHKTVGWVYGLSIAALALNRHEARADFIERFSGTYPKIADYLMQEVFAKQSQDMREFLLSTSVLRRLTVPLCNELTGRHDSAEMLKQLDAEDLFLAPIESRNEPAYRYHSLFAGTLRNFLTRERPDDAMRLHRIASAWYESQNQPVPAIDHALEAKDYEKALRLLSWKAETLLEQGRMNLLHRWFSAIPEEMLAHDPMLQVTYAWAVNFVIGPMEATVLLNRLGCEYRGDRLVHVNPLIHVNLLAFQLLMKSYLEVNEDKHEIIEMGREALKLVTTGRSFVQDLLVTVVSSSLSVIGKRAEAQQLLNTVQNSQRGPTPIGKLFFETVEGHFDLLEGRLRSATARFQMALSDYPVTHRNLFGNTYPGVFYASVLYEHDECAMAESLLRVYLPYAESTQLFEHVIVAYIILSRIAYYGGNAEKALHLLDGLEQFGCRKKLPRAVTTARLERSRLLLMQSRFSEAKAELDRADDPEMRQLIRSARLLANDTEYFELCELRWQIMTGNAELALPGLEKEISEAVASLRHRRAIKLQLLLALALDRTGDRAGAFVILSKLLRCTYTEGFYRLIVDEGPHVGTLVRHFEKVYQQQGTDHDPIFASYLQRLLCAFSAIPVQIAKEDKELDAQPAENLTPKEIRILYLVAEGYTNKTIGQKLFVSESTVRTHMRSINSKLGASNRTEAVAIARRLQVIVN